MKDERTTIVDGIPLITVPAKRIVDKNARRTSGLPDDAGKSLAVKQDGDGKHVVEGYGAVWNNIDLGGEIIRKGTFSQSVSERVPARKVKLMAEHFCYGGGTLECIGTVVEAKEDDFGLLFKAEIASTHTAQEVMTLIAEDHVRGLSVGYGPLDYHWAFVDSDGNELTGEDREAVGKEVLIHTKAKLYEITATPFPMNELAEVTAAKSVDRITASVKSLADKKEAGSVALQLEEVANALESLKGSNGKDLTAAIDALGTELTRLLQSSGKAKDGDALSSDLHAAIVETERCRTELESLSL